MNEDDRRLVERIRPLMQRRRGYSEKKMFGGVCFMINGNMCVGPWKGSLIVRLDRQHHEQTQSEPFVLPMDITGRVMKGWATVEPEAMEDDADLTRFCEEAIGFVSGLPPKR
ncbi:MAG: TfoX/Sxy family protein [Planctomycetales bacterium]|nr:TfoX/Sxy family protein [Planctomycetales bacterium]